MPYRIQLSDGLIPAVDRSIFRVVRVFGWAILDIAIALLAGVSSATVLAFLFVSLLEPDVVNIQDAPTYVFL